MSHRPDTNRPARILAMPVLLLGALLLLAGAASAYETGTIVSKKDLDVVAPAGSKDVALCFVDLDGDGIYDAYEPAYLAYDTTTCDRVNKEDVRFHAMGDEPAGEEVGSSDEDVFKVLTAVPDHAIRFVEMGGEIGDGNFDDTDTLYLDLTGIASSTVSVGDLRLSPYGDLPAMAVVGPGDADLSSSLQDLGASKALSQFGAKASVNTFLVALDGYYIETDVNGDSKVESKDVRINQKAFHPKLDADLGTPDIQVTAIEPTQETVAPGAPFQVHITVTNAGDGAGSGLIETTLDGTLVDARGSGTLEPGAEATLVVTLVAPSQAGDVVLASGAVSGTVNILAADAKPMGEAATQAQVDDLQLQLQGLRAQLRDMEKGLEAEDLRTASLDDAEMTTMDAGTQDAPAPGIALVGLVLAGIASLRRRD